jgi:hypothetical protein
MVTIPPALMSKFNEQPQIRAIPSALHGSYLKWLRYYLDFCKKYHAPPKQAGSLPLFIQKLQEKKASNWAAGTGHSSDHDILRYFEREGKDRHEPSA